MKVLVTGGSGFLGSHLCEQLVAQGHEVRALVRRSSDRSFLKTLRGLTLAEGGVEEADAVARAAEGVDAIIHSAGLVRARNAGEFMRTNAGGTTNLLSAAKRQPGIKRFVLVSSLSVLGPSQDGMPVRDDAPPNPLTHYARSKLEAERLAREAAGELPITILRPSMIYGPRDRETLAFFKTIQRGVLPYLGTGRNTLSVTYAADCARACVQALTRDVPSGSTYSVDDGRAYVWLDMLKEMEAAMGKQAFLRFSVPFPILRAAALGSELVGKLTNQPVMLTRDKVNELAAPHWVCDSARTRKDLDWEPRVDWSQGVREAVRWYRSAGWL